MGRVAQRAFVAHSGHPIEASREALVMSVTFSPIGPWLLVVLFAVGVTVLTVWAYRQRLKGTTGRWRWIALALRLAAVLLCVLAAFRPSVVLREKKTQTSSLLFLIDASTSMTLNDEAGGKTRWERASSTLAEARNLVKGLGPNLESKFYRFDASLQEQPADDKSPPKGRSTALGDALREAVKRSAGTRVASVVVLADGANNDGFSPLEEAHQLRSQQIPVVTVGFGSENAGPGSHDISLRDLVAGPTVFVKNQLQVKGAVVVRGFPNQPIDVEMWVDRKSDQDKAVAETHLKAPEGTEVVPLTGLKYIPQTPGEKMITIRVKPKDGELLTSNNEVSTFVTVLAGGLNVLFLQGPHSPWEHKFLQRAIAASPDIEADLRVLLKPPGDGKSNIDDSEFAPGKYNVYILSDLPANFLTPIQQQLLTRAVEKGAGLIMLGGRSSFGPGGWADTSVARVLPVDIHPGDGQNEPEQGVKFVPNQTGLDNFLFQVGPNRPESRRIWNALPKLPGANRFGAPKLGAFVLAETEPPVREPLMIGMNSPAGGRVLAFAGETWVWARASDEGRLAHRKFWRQIIFWLSRKEDQGENTVKIALDRRRIAIGQKIEMTVTARDAKNVPLTDVTYETKVSREDAPGVSEPVPMYSDGEQSRGTYPALNGQPGVYKVTVKGSRGGAEIGHDEARFLVYQDDREMENPAADLNLLRQIAQDTAGQSLAPEKLANYLKSLDGKVETEYVTPTEHRIWDNWPFFLIFTAILTLEWWLRKRNGWV
jgi:uncharacterized membrane protein